MNELANMLAEQGKYDEARPLYERALAIFEKAHGKSHLDIAMVLTNFAGMLNDSGAHDKARSMYERAEAIFNEVEEE